MTSPSVAGSGTSCRDLAWLRSVPSFGESRTFRQLAFRALQDGFHAVEFTAAPARRIFSGLLVQKPLSTSLFQHFQAGGCQQAWTQRQLRRRVAVDIGDEYDSFGSENMRFSLGVATALR